MGKDRFRKQLEQYYWWRPTQRLPQETLKDRYLARLNALDSPLGLVGRRLLGLEPDEEDVDDWDTRGITEDIITFDELPATDRLKLLRVFFPAMADLVEWAWQYLRTLPYEPAWSTAQPYRAPGEPAVSLRKRVSWLEILVGIAARFRDEVFEPVWIATWCPHFHTGYGEAFAVGWLLGAVLARQGERLSEEVYRVLVDSANNVHEVGRMGSHLLVALASSPRPEGWELLERLLLAAQRQEGFRQSILSAVANGHVGALRRSLTCIESRDLTRFSSVVQALKYWTALDLSALQPARVKRVVRLLTRCLTEEEERQSALSSSSPLEVYAALWCAGVEDASRAVELAESLLERKEPEVRFAATYFLKSAVTESADHALAKAVYDEDLVVALQGISGVIRCTSVHVHARRGATPSWDPQLTDHLERLRERVRHELPKKAGGIERIWEYANLAADYVDWALVECLQSAPAERLAATFPTLEPLARSRLVHLIEERARREPAVRRVLLHALADRSTWVQKSAAEALAKARFTREELKIVESFLKRRGQALRMRLLNLILRHDDERVLESVRSLLGGDAAQQLAGVELLEQLVAAGRSRDRCRQVLENYLAADGGEGNRRDRRKASRKRRSTGDAARARAAQVLQKLGGPSPRERSGAVSGPSTAFGLLENARVTPPLRPRKRRVRLVTDAAANLLESLDNLVAEHRDEPLYPGRKDRLLGEEVWFPEPRRSATREENARAFPLRALWEKWLEDPGRPRDSDGLELVRAYLWPQLWKQTPKPVLRDLGSERMPPRLKYRSVVSSVLHWLLHLFPAPNATTFVVDLCETLMYMAGQLAEKRKKERSDQEGTGRSFSPASLAELAMSWIEELVAVDVEHADKRQLKRAWRIVRWAEETFGEELEESRLKILRQMYLAGVATEGDWYDHLLGRNHTETWKSYDELWSMTVYGPWHWELAEYLARAPQLRSVLDRCRERILDIELARGDHASPVTKAALSLESIFGLKPLLRILRALGNTPLRLNSPVRGTRSHSFAWLLHVTYPAEGDSPEQAAQELRALVENEGLPDQRLVELGLIAPQWSRCVELALGWPGYCSAVAWIRFHTLVPPDPYAILHMLPDEQRPRETRDIDPDLLLRQYSSLTMQQLHKGAVDADWFHRIQEELGRDRWERVLQAVKAFTTPQRAAKVSMISDTLLGRLARDQLIQEVVQKKKKLAVQLLGLLPLRSGRGRKKDLMERYRVLQEYRAYARKLGPLSKPDALAAADAGLRNLAATAGYQDELRMEWKLGAATAKQLLKGKKTVRAGDAVVRMEVDQACRPSIIIERSGKMLRALPKELKKNPEIAELYERASELKEQSARARRTLESMMCRAESFTTEELQELSAHPLVGPLLSKLVLVGQGIMGYPEHGGRALRDYQGKLEPLKRGETLRIAHPLDFWERGDWSAWQHECFVAERIQPFKQVFRELYLVTRQEKEDRTVSRRYAGHQVQPRQAAGLWTNRDWRAFDSEFCYYPEVGKEFPEHDIAVTVQIELGITTPLEVEGWLIEGIRFHRRSTGKPVPLADVPPIIFSEVMRDVDLVVSVAHVGGVEPEATASTVEMRARLVMETCQLLGLTNVEVKQNRAFIEGTIGRYTVHLGSGVVHKMPGGAVCLVPVPSQHRGRLFLPFADDDPKTAEVVSKVLLLARDEEIRDPILLEQLRT